MKTTFHIPAPLRRQPRANLAPPPQTQTTPSPHFASTPEWWHVRGAIISALQHHPEARESIIKTLRDLQVADGTEEPSQAGPDPNAGLQPAPNGELNK